MSELDNARGELARLEGERDLSETKAGELEAGLIELRGSMGSKVMAGADSHEVAVEVMAGEAEVEAARLSVDILARAILDAQAVVKGAMVKDYQARADATKREAERHGRKVAKLVNELRALEETDSLTVSCWREPKSKSGLLAEEAEYLSQAAFRLGHGLPVLPRLDIPIPSLPE